MWGAALGPTDARHCRGTSVILLTASLILRAFFGDQDLGRDRSLLTQHPPLQTQVQGSAAHPHHLETHHAKGPWPGHSSCRVPQEPEPVLQQSAPSGQG